ncbi:MFS transporter [Paenibacillus paeoniae]|uniref:MFS transporter n=1 Tax=Paenibacillus paeoniae TaxID=2292705 RepID=A0A371P0K4_9BACL|nr:MFS transporter [Paenibacillus paeoniae]REK69474.1 MFS transporter [Paenibacillus paeoniae]
MKKLLWMGCLSYLVIGIAHVIGGTLLEQLITHYGITYKDGGQWIMNQFIGFMFGVLLAPALTSRIGKRGAVLVAMALLTLSEAAYSLLLPWGWMLAFAPIAGIGFGMTEAIVGATIIDLMKGKASAMSRLETFFGIGALLIPITAALLIQQHVWQLSFPILAAMAGITFVLWLTMSFGCLDDSLSPPQRAAVGGEGSVQQAAAMPQYKSPNTGLLGYAPKSIPFLALSAAFFLIYVGMEMSFSNYLPSILILRTGMTDSTATAALSLFWGTMVLGRLFAGIIADRIGYAKYLFITTAAAAVVFVGMIVFEQQALLLALIALSGLCFSGVFGIALVYANGLLPGMTERTTSLLVALGGIGGAVFPRLTGWFMDRFSTGPTLYYLSALVLALLVVLVMLIMTGRSQFNRIKEKEVAPT